MTRYAGSVSRRQCPYSRCSGSCWRSTRPWTRRRVPSPRPAARTCSLGSSKNYALERWDGLTRYCEEGYYDIDNNVVERSIRPLTLGRKNWRYPPRDTR